MDKKILVSDLRGAAQLSCDAVNAITDLVEAVHATIFNTVTLDTKADNKRTTGISGMVYSSIRAFVDLVGASLDSLLKRFSSRLSESCSSSEREMILAALNGVLGDYLAETENPLNITMQLRRHGEPVDFDDASFIEALKHCDGKILLMVHGACMNDLQWDHEGHNHAACIAHDFNYLPIYLHYNTGLHVSKNGRALAKQLEDLLSRIPFPIELNIVSFSMGGLVTRSAYHYAKLTDYSWARSLRKIVFLGTPHHGSMVERAGHVVDTALAWNPYSRPFARLGKIRSAGITDLRFGNLLDEDWQGQDRFGAGGDSRHPVPLPEGVQCYTIAATTGTNATTITDQVIGDGLVTLESALGHHDNPALTLHFPESQQYIVRDCGHFDLLSRTDVYTILKSCLSQAESDSR